MMKQYLFLVSLLFLTVLTGSVSINEEEKSLEENDPWGAMKKFNLVMQKMHHHLEEISRAPQVQAAINANTTEGEIKAAELQTMIRGEVASHFADTEDNIRVEKEQLLEKIRDAMEYFRSEAQGKSQNRIDAGLESLDSNLQNIRERIQSERSGIQGKAAEAARLASKGGPDVAVPPMTSFSEDFEKSAQALSSNVVRDYAPRFQEVQNTNKSASSNATDAKEPDISKEEALEQVESIRKKLQAAKQLKLVKEMQKKFRSEVIASEKQRVEALRAKLSTVLQDDVQKAQEVGMSKLSADVSSAISKSGFASLPRDLPSGTDMAKVLHNSLQKTFQSLIDQAKKVVDRAQSGDIPLSTKQLEEKLNIGAKKPTKEVASLDLEKESREPTFDVELAKMLVKTK